jgi:hypothetical protein
MYSARARILQGEVAVIGNGLPMDGVERAVRDDTSTAVLFGEAELEHGYDITRAAPLRKQAESSPRSPPISTRQHDDG